MAGTKRRAQHGNGVDAVAGRDERPTTSLSAGQAQRRASRLQTLTVELSRNLALAEVLQQVVEAASELLQSPIAAVFLLDATGRALVMAAAQGIELPKGDSLRFPRRRSLGGRALELRSTQTLNDVSRSRSVALPRLVGGRSVGALVAAPIQTPTESLGVVEVYSPAPRTWSDEDVELLSALAAAAAIAVANARLYESAQEAVRTRDELLATVSHDLKHPLTTVSGLAQLLRRRLEGVPPTQAGPLAEGLARIHELSLSMAGALDEMVESLQAETGRRMSLRRRPLDLVALVREVAAGVQAGAPGHDIRLEAPPTLVGSWDAARLERVIHNLIGNAVKYSVAGGAVEVVVRSDAGWAVVEVRDQGMGIDAEDLPLIFQMFRRGRNAATVPGTGIGLASVKHVVEQHGGSVSVESAPGRGSTFTVRLPCGPAGQASKASA